MAQPKDLVHVATITSAHGIRGEVKLRSFTSDPADIFTLTLADASGKPFALTRKGAQGETLIVAIDGVSDRNTAETLKNTVLYAHAETLMGKDRQKHELIGLEARLPDGSVFGKVIAFHNFGAGDILEFERPGKTEMLPLNENFIGEIHPKEGWLEVFLPEYVEAGDD